MAFGLGHTLGWAAINARATLTTARLRRWHVNAICQMRSMLQCQRRAIFDLLDIRLAELDIAVRPNSASSKQIAPESHKGFGLNTLAWILYAAQYPSGIVCILNMNTTALRTPMPITFKLPRDPQCEHQEHTHTQNYMVEIHRHFLSRHIKPHCPWHLTTCTQHLVYARTSHTKDTCAVWHAVRSHLGPEPKSMQSNVVAYLNTSSIHIYTEWIMAATNGALMATTCW